MRYPDLTPVKDPKGGSPKTPIPPYTVSEFQGYSSAPNGHASGVWKVIACSAITALMGMTVAYFTALRAQGVPEQELTNLRKELQEYTDTKSPYTKDKELINRDNSNQDRAIGELTGKQDRIFDRLSKIDEKVVVFDRDITDHDKKIKTIVDYMEAEKTPRR